MEIEKIKVPVNQALPMIAEMVKFKYVTDRIGVSSGWIYNKLNHEKTTAKSKGFTQSDIESLNGMFYQIGEELLNTRISNPLCEDIVEARINIVNQLKRLSKIISMPFIYINKLEKNKKWYENRTSNPKSYCFKEEDLTLINMAIVEIGNKLLSIELTL